MRRFTTFAVCLLAGAAPAAAEASAEIGPDRVVVTGEGARAVVERSPFRLSFEDPVTGAVVLRQVSSSLSGPVPGATLDPEPGGVDNVPDTSLYAPFAFEVGGERSVQHHGGLWQGNMLTSVQGGVGHFAREVRSAEPAGEGVRLELSTTDPSRTLIVLIEPDTGSGIRVRATLSNPDGVAALSDSFETGEGEAFRGFGGRHNALDQRGNDFYSWIEQENFEAPESWQPVTGHIPGSGGEQYLFPSGPEAAYYVQNLFVSSRPYGFFVNQTELTRWRMASERPDAWQAVVAAPRLDYTVAVGEGPEAIRTLAAINGSQHQPPEWSQGPIVKRGVHLFNDDRETYHQKVADDLVKLRELRLPVTGYAYEGWAGLEPEFVRETNRQLRAMGIHPIGYLRAFVADDELFDPEGTFDEAFANGYLARTPTGQPYVYPAHSPAGVIDYTNPAAVAWWERRVRHMLDLGFDGFMNDFGEQTVADMHFANGQTGLTMHNEYPNVMHRVTREIVDRYEAEHPGRELFFYTRAGFSGRRGSAHYEDWNFPGDEASEWGRALGIQSLATDMLSRAVGGAIGFSTDIGGYFDSIYEDLTKELFVRWIEWSALTPLFRVHNSCCDQGTRMPWSYDAETLDVYRAMADLHLRARPLIRELWAAFARTGKPPTRPLWLSYPDDPEAARQDQQWLLGDDVLVAPVVEEGATTRRVYFPRGCWRAPEGGERHSGPGYAEVPAPLGRLPYFFRCGTDPLARAAARRGPRLALRCRGGSLRVSVRGSAARELRRVDFHVGSRRVASDRSRPFVRTLRSRLFQGSRWWRVRAVTNTAAGDRGSLRARHPRCARAAPRFTG